MSEINTVVSVAITVADKAISQAGFGTPMILTHEDFFSPLVQSFASTAAMITAGASATGPTVAAATAMLAQSPSPPLIKVGKRTSTITDQVKTVTVAVAQNATKYDVTINALTASFTSDADATAAEISAGLKAAIDLTTAIIVVADGTGSITLTTTATLTAHADTTAQVVGDIRTNAGQIYKVTVAGTTGSGTAPTGTVFGIEEVDGGVTWKNVGTVVTLETLFGLKVAPVFPDKRFLTIQDATAEAGIAADYAAIKLEDNDFYGVMMTSDSEIEINALATALSADKKIHIAHTANQDVLLDDPGNLGEDLNAAAHDRTALIWSGENFDYANAAWLGKQLPTVVGSSTWKFKTLTGVTVDDLGPTEISKLDSNKANHYTPVGGVNITREGTMASGRFIDVQRGVDWLDARISEEIFSVLVNNQEVSFEDAGLTLIQSAIEAVLAQGITNGLVATLPAPTVTMPLASSLLSTDKKARKLTGVKFAATLLVGIHTVAVAGTVST